MQKAKTLRLSLSGLIALVQVFDISLHIITYQIELIRILASVALLIGLALTLSPGSGRSLLVLAISGAIYLLLNGIFVIENGVSNPVSGEPRALMIPIVLATAIFGVLHAHSIRKDPTRS